MKKNALFGFPSVGISRHGMAHFSKKRDCDPVESIDKTEDAVGDFFEELAFYRGGLCCSMTSYLH